MKPETFFLGGMGAYLLCCWADALGDDPVACPRAVSRTRSYDPRSDLGDLGEGELDRGLPAEDGDEHLELLGVGVDLGDGCGQRLERAVHDGDGLADLEIDDRGLALAAGAAGLATRGGGAGGGLEVG